MGASTIIPSQSISTIDIVVKFIQKCGPKTFVEKRSLAFN